MVDYIVHPAIWTVGTTSACWQKSIGVALVTNEQPGNSIYQYSLTDSIGMRNTTRATGSLC